ncbi:N4-gp56 family major capsid protein [Clostridium perfringens]|uniref:N4-gp56 family major capsid protein n=1 Tax=Clostridium perfringens TaxID=1502 RepID=UPI002B217635|nr:N4-gp56 family major capsid protein [Clostridium perfringens]MEA5269362.1 N4-gp56 family major capsid protein [Clostridium perfringens]MEA5309335.1 N4-gp56 family major capsid protein [Clostridium perfringens]MEA5339842.1 N4-gp56 family major capsid protein [Clostridium perfringens]
MAVGPTKISDIINPQVMADMISAKIPKKIRVAPFAKIDDTLQGRPGDTITIPAYAYIGDAEDVAEGEKAGTVKLTATTKTAKVKKVMKAVSITDEAVLSGYGNPVGEANNQLALSVSSKVDNDCLDEVLKATTKTHDLSNTAPISYEGIVDAIDLFDEEENAAKVMFINPKQVTQLRKDPNFISTDKYPGHTIVSGEIGKICNTRVVPSKKIVLKSSTHYVNPIIKLEEDLETEDEAPAVTIFLKRNVNLETERDTLARTTIASIDEHYVAAVTNPSKIVLVKFKKSAE